MTNEERHDLGKRMKRIEDDIAEIKAALLGNVVDGSPGLVGRVRDRERVAENHDLRLVRLETERINYASRQEMAEIETRLEDLEKARERLIGALILASAIGAAGGGALVTLIGG